MINDYKARKQEKNEQRADEEYINDCLSSHYKNAYYKICGNYDVYLQNPQMYNVVRKEIMYLGTDNIPTYVIKFSSLGKAKAFFKNNFFMGVKHQKSVDINIVSTVLSSAIIIKPTNIDYEIHIEVYSEEVAQKLVKMFRQQYIDNKHCQHKAKKYKKIISQDAENEIEKLGIEF